MELKPRTPPGRANRKLREFVSEIERLNAEGYTTRVIHQALEDAGVKVSVATVQREVAQLTKKRPALSQSSASQDQNAQTLNPVRSVSKSGGTTVTPASDVDKFFDAHNSNPLFNRGKKP